MVRDCDTMTVRKDRGYLGRIVPVCVRVPYTYAQTSQYFTAPFFTADRHYEVLSAVVRFEVGSGVGGVLSVAKLRNGEAVPAGSPFSGVSPVVGNVNVGVFTNRNFTLYGDPRTCHLNPGDALALHCEAGGNLEGVTVCVNLKAT